MTPNLNYYWLILPLWLLPTASLAQERPLPDHTLTTGVTRPLTKAKICSTRWGRDRRHVTPAMKAQVFESYNCTGNNSQCCTPDHHGRFCEIDHLISRELGGADDTKNLWPQPYGGVWNATQKDRLENRLHKEVCSGTLPLSKAQKLIRTNWISAYRSYFGEPQ